MERDSGRMLILKELLQFPSGVIVRLVRIGNDMPF